MSDQSENAVAVEPSKGSALVIRANIELHDIDRLIRSSRAHQLFKQAWEQFIRGWRRLFEELGQGRGAISASSARQVIALRNEGRQWQGDFHRLRAAGFPRPIEEMNGWEAGLCDPDELGALVYTPGVIKAELEAVNTAATQLDVDIKASKVRDEFKNAWRGFLAEWQAFYKNNKGLWSRLWGSVFEKAAEYRKRVELWRQALEREGGHPSSPSIVVPESGSSGWKWILIGAGSLVATGVVITKVLSR
jgi:hypothetical protein